MKSDTVKCKVKVAIEIGQCCQNLSEDSGVEKSGQIKSESPVLVLPYLKCP